MLVMRGGAAVEAAQREVGGHAALAPARGKTLLQPWGSRPWRQWHLTLGCSSHAPADATHATPAGKRRKKELLLCVEEALALRGCVNLACTNCAGASETGCWVHVSSQIYTALLVSNHTHIDWFACIAFQHIEWWRATVQETEGEVALTMLQPSLNAPPCAQHVFKSSNAPQPRAQTVWLLVMPHVCSG